MLAELYVENFALIEKVNVFFKKGLNVLTGETGAGKSLIIDAVSLLMGGRASQEMVRTGTAKAVIQGTFHEPIPPDVILKLQEAGLETEESILILNREILKSGKHNCRINFRTVPLSLFREIGRKLVNIHGQHEHIALLEAQNQLLLLDSFGGEEIISLKEKVSQYFSARQELKRRVEEIRQGTRDAERQKDLLKYQLAEIEAASLQPGEEEKLHGERKLLLNAEKLSQESRSVYEKLYGTHGTGAIDLTGEAASILKNLSKLDDQLASFSEKLDEVYYLLEDLSREITSYRENIVSDPRRLDQVEKRLVEIGRLYKKYGGTTEEVFRFREEAQKELYGLEHFEENVQALEEALKNEDILYCSMADKLTSLRLKAAEKLSSAVTKELHQLYMPGAQFLVQLRKSSAGLLGTDTVEFQIRPNDGEGFKPVARIASGGEMSRIMLGIKVILAGLDQIPTLIFDEIDSGLGGTVVYAVGEKLSLISENTQVLCVTHSPVVAAFADNHLFISKNNVSGRTVTGVIALEEKLVLEELSRMLAGDKATETTMAQAYELRSFGLRKRKTS